MLSSPGGQACRLACGNCITLAAWADESALMHIFCNDRHAAWQLEHSPARRGASARYSPRATERMPRFRLCQLGANSLDDCNTSGGGPSVGSMSNFRLGSIANTQPAILRNRFTPRRQPQTIHAGYRSCRDLVLDFTPPSHEQVQGFRLCFRIGLNWIRDT